MCTTTSRSVRAWIATPVRSATDWPRIARRPPYLLAQTPRRPTMLRPISLAPTTRAPETEHRTRPPRRLGKQVRRSAGDAWPIGRGPDRRRDPRTDRSRGGRAHSSEAGARRRWLGRDPAPRSPAPRGLRRAAPRGLGALRWGSRAGRRWPGRAACSAPRCPTAAEQHIARRVWPVCEEAAAAHRWTLAVASHSVTRLSAARGRPRACNGVRGDKIGSYD